METRARQRRKHNSENETDGELWGEHDNMSDNKCLAEQKSLIAFLSALDVHLTKKLALCTCKDDRFGYLRPLMKVLEISCHGIPWLLGNFIAFFIATDPLTLEKLVNLFYALLVDLVIVAAIKLAARRPRPSENQMDMFATVSVDHFSFPSGHATRAALVALFWIHWFPSVPLPGGGLVVMAWSLAVAMSRILLGRHHVGDVMAGITVGYLEFRLVALLWLPRASCAMLLRPLAVAL